MSRQENRDVREYFFIGVLGVLLIFSFAHMYQINELGKSLESPGQLSEALAPSKDASGPLTKTTSQPAVRTQQAPQGPTMVGGC